MSILVDREIALRCKWQGKKITVTDAGFGQWRPGQVFLEIDPEMVNQYFQVMNDAVAAGQPRPFVIEDLKEEEEASWCKPMISPFVGEQVRSMGGYLRSPTDEEEKRWDEEDPMRLEMRSYRTPVQKIISYGLSSAGYDVRLGRDFKLFTNVGNHHPLIDPLNMPDDYFIEQLDRDYCIIPPHSYVLGHTVEIFNVPKDILIECVGKSTYARCGIAVNVTPIEPGFEGQVVIEVANQTPLPAKIYSGMGIAQFLFHKANERCQVGYGDRGGKYQGQRGIVGALL